MYCGVTVGYCGVLWGTVVCGDVRLCTVGYYCGVLLCTVVYYCVLLCTIVYCCVLWSTVVYFDVP